MAFRAYEKAQEGYEEVERYFLGNLKVDPKQRALSAEKLRDLADEIGPAVTSYPTWHPLVTLGNSEGHQGRHGWTTPGRECGYAGVDHSKFFVNGFITCPYGDGQEVIDSVERFRPHHAAHITAERLDVTLYNADATPILVRCEWSKLLPADGLIPLSVAMPLLLEVELPCWEWSEVAETWDSMRRHFLGAPHGARSSLFVSQETGQAMKKIWEALIYTGMYGPIKV